jgi:hypothetical protein
MGVVMNMSSYEIEYYEEEYGEEVLCSGWNPVVAMTCPQHLPVRTPLPPGLAAVDAEAFLRKMYACQR